MMDLKNSKLRSEILAKYATLITLAVIVIVFIFTTENFRFIQSDNVLNVLRQVSILSIVALGVTFAMASGEMDMSTGAIVGLSGVLTMGLITNQHLSPYVAIVIVLIMGLFVGTINAFVTTYLRIPSIIVTLGMQSIIKGMIYMYSNGKALYGENPEVYNWLGQKLLFGFLPTLVVTMLVFIVVAYFILNKTLVGRYIYATGGSQTTARLSGVSTTLYIYIGMMISGVFAAFAGILLASRLGSGQPTAGDTYTMDALSSVFIGMTTIRIGRANVVGTIIGVFLLGVMSNGLNLLGWPYFFQDMAKGLVMIVAVAFAASKSELKFFK